MGGVNSHQLCNIKYLTPVFPSLILLSCPYLVPTALRSPRPSPSMRGLPITFVTSAKPWSAPANLPLSRAGVVWPWGPPRYPPRFLPHGNPHPTPGWPSGWQKFSSPWPSPPPPLPPRPAARTLLSSVARAENLHSVLLRQSLSVDC